MSNPRVEGYDEKRLGVIDEFHKYYEDDCIICKKPMWVPSLFSHDDYCDVCEKKYACQMEAKSKKDFEKVRLKRLKELGIRRI